MSFINDVLGNPLEEKPAKKSEPKPVPKPTPKDVPISKPAEPEKKPDSKPAEPAKKPEPKPAEPAKKPEPKPAETPKRRTAPPPLTSEPTPTKADLGALLDEKENIYAKVSVKVSVTELFANLSINDKLRLIAKDAQASDIVWKIVDKVVENTPDALLDYYGNSLLDTAFSCDDLRGKMLKRIIGNDEWAAYVIDAIIEEEKRQVFAEEKLLKEFTEELVTDEKSLRSVVETLLASGAGRQAIYDAIRKP